MWHASLMMIPTFIFIKNIFSYNLTSGPLTLWWSNNFRCVIPVSVKQWTCWSSGQAVRMYKLLGFKLPDFQEVVRAYANSQLVETIHGDPSHWPCMCCKAQQNIRLTLLEQGFPKNNNMYGKKPSWCPTHNKQTITLVFSIMSSM